MNGTRYLARIHCRRSVRARDLTAARTSIRSMISTQTMIRTQAAKVRKSGEAIHVSKWLQHNNKYKQRENGGEKRVDSANEKWNTVQLNKK